MTVNSTTFVKDVFDFVKSGLTASVTDPISSARATNSKFIMTSYPKREVQYPLITIKIIGISAERAGMQTAAVNTTIRLEVRIWGKNEIDKDTLYTSVFNVLRNAQFTSSSGSIANGLHNFRVINTIEIDEEGDNQPKSRLLEVEYDYYTT